VDAFICLSLCHGFILKKFLLLRAAGKDTAEIRALRKAGGPLAVDDGFQENLAGGEFDFHANALGAGRDFYGDRFSGDF
jgi:hypothetical protein